MAFKDLPDTQGDIKLLCFNVIRKPRKNYKSSYSLDSQTKIFISNKAIGPSCINAGANFHSNLT